VRGIHLEHALKHIYQYHIHGIEPKPTLIIFQFEAEKGWDFQVSKLDYEKETHDWIFWKKDVQLTRCQ
jgi:hypothetical protein